MRSPGTGWTRTPAACGAWPISIRTGPIFRCVVVLAAGGKRAPWRSTRPAPDTNWLAAALTRARLSGPAVELYRRELDADPQTALHGPYAHLLELPGASGNSLLAIATARLAVAAPNARWALLDIDLAALAHRAADLDEGAWLGYLTDLAARAAGDRPPLLEQCRHLLAGLRHLELSHGSAFDRLEHRQLTRARLRAAPLADPIRRALVAEEAGGGGGEALGVAVAWAAADPCAALRACDVGMTSEVGRGFLTAFGQFLTDRAERPAEYPSGLVPAKRSARTPDAHVGTRLRARPRPAAPVPSGRTHRPGRIGRRVLRRSGLRGARSHPTRPKR